MNVVFCVLQNGSFYVYVLFFGVEIFRVELVEIENQEQEMM